MTRQEFITEVKAGQGAFRRFLIGLCCGDSSLADDIAQEAYLKAWLSIDNFRKEANLDTWIRKIAINTFLNIKRSKKIFSEINESSLEILANENDDVNLKYQFLYEALKLLSEKERSAILLFYLENYSIAEIATITDNSVNAVKKQLSRGRENLRKIIPSIS